MVCNVATELSDVTLTHLRPLIGRPFRATDPLGRWLELVLVGVTDMRPRCRATSAASDHDSAGNAAVAGSGDETESLLVDPEATRPIALLFLGPHGRPLVDGLYDLEISWLALPGLRLTPMGPSQGPGRDGLLYEAVLD